MLINDFKVLTATIHLRVVVLLFEAILSFSGMYAAMPRDIILVVGNEIIELTFFRNVCSHAP